MKEKLITGKKEEINKSMKEKIKKVLSLISLNRLLKIVIIFAILAICLSIVYYFLIFIPQREKREEARLSVCLSMTDLSYSADWKANCRLEGKSEDCDNLLSYHAEALEKARQNAKDNCFKQYK